MRAGGMAPCLTRKGLRDRLEKTKPNSSIRVLLFSAFSACLYYNSPLTLHLLGGVQDHSQSGILYSWMEHLYSCTKLRPAQLKVCASHCEGRIWESSRVRPEKYASPHIDRLTLSPAR